MQVPICRHIKTNGLQCRGAALIGSAFCYFHRRLHATHDLYRNKVHFQSAQLPHPHFLQLPAVEDRESAQLAISCVLNALATHTIDAREATALFYGLQLASANARGLRIVRRPTQLVRDVQKELYALIPEASPDIAPDGLTCEIEDPAEFEPSADPGAPQPALSLPKGSQSDHGVTPAALPIQQPTPTNPQPTTNNQQPATNPQPATLLTLCAAAANLEPRTSNLEPRT